MTTILLSAQDSINKRCFFFISVKIQPYKTNNPAQCYNYQQFGHSSLYYGYVSHFVKFAGHHQAKECAPKLFCFPMTIKKAQGQTLKITDVDNTDFCLTHGPCNNVRSRDIAAINLYIYPIKSEFRITKLV